MGTTEESFRLRGINPLFRAMLLFDTKGLIPKFCALHWGFGVSLIPELRIAYRGPVTEYQEWKGPVFLPNNRGKFYAILAGETESHPFSPAMDQLELRPSARHRIFQHLIESNFVGKPWSLRSSSRHAKSKTYRR